MDHVPACQERKGFMKLLWRKIPLLFGCLFLAAVLTTMLHLEVSQTWQEYADQKAQGQAGRDIVMDDVVDAGFYLPRMDWEKIRDIPACLSGSGAGFAYIGNAIIYRYNSCGYYTRNLPYLYQDGTVTPGGIYAAYALFFLLVLIIMALPMLLWGRMIQIFLLTGVQIGLFLLIGQSLPDSCLFLLFFGCIYCNGAFRYFQSGSETEQAVRRNRVSWMLIPSCFLLIFLLFGLSAKIPLSRFPDTAQAKESISDRIQTVYSFLKKDSEDTALDDTKRKQEASASGASRETSRQQSSGQEQTESRGENANRTQPSGQNRQTETTSGQKQGILPAISNQFQAGSGAGNGIGFFLKTGGGVSGGRTDKTGNLDFSGRTVMEVSSDTREKPDQDIYIRFFYAENYKDNRWQVQNRPGQSKTVETYYAKAGNQEGRIGNTLLITDSSGKRSRLSQSNVEGSTSRRELETYLNQTCKAVPGELGDLLQREFPSIYATEETKNQREVEISRRVEDALDDQAFYTLSPGSLPAGKDFITWFLTENRKGYCMHFASAGVMMLREAGISSRYAEGYVVPVSSWKQQTDGSWKAQVQDSNAHAWAEIYLTDRENWAPVEVTPAYNGRLAGEFAGERDVYIGERVIPAFLVKVIKILVTLLILVILVMVLATIFFQSRKYWKKHREYRLLHTGNAGLDVIHMMKLLLKESFWTSGEVRALLRKKDLSQQDLKSNIPRLFAGQESTEEIDKAFRPFCDLVYKAAFGENFSGEERKQAQELYERLKKKTKTKRRNQRKRRIPPLFLRR